MAYTIIQDWDPSFRKTTQMIWDRKFLIQHCNSPVLETAFNRFWDETSASQKMSSDFRKKVFDKILSPLIKNNYEQRRKKLIPDEWYWADRISVWWKIFVDD